MTNIANAIKYAGDQGSHVSCGTADYHYMFDTSMATPYAAGVALLIKPLNPSFTESQVQARLKSTAVDLGPAGEDDMFGAGRIDVGDRITHLPSSPLARGPHSVEVTSADGSHGEARWIFHVGSQQTPSLPLPFLLVALAIGVAARRYRS